MSIEANFR